jgi:hypothetical protein
LLSHDGRLAKDRQRFVTGTHNRAPISSDARAVAIPALIVMRICWSVTGYPVSDTANGPRKNLVIDCLRHSDEFSNITFTESMIYVFLANRQKQVSFGRAGLFFEHAFRKGSLIDL